MVRINLAIATFTSLVSVLAISTMPSLAQQPTRATTVFECARYNTSDYASLARRGDQVSPPMIVWTKALGNYTPLDRCNIVNDRLNRAISRSAGRTLSSLYLTYGRVNRNSVICYVNSMNEGCTNQNLLFTLRREDRGKEQEILEKIANFRTLGTSNPVSQSRVQYYAPLGQEVEKSFSVDPKKSSQPSVPQGRF